MRAGPRTQTEKERLESLKRRLERIRRKRGTMVMLTCSEVDLLLGDKEEKK